MLERLGVFLFCVLMVFGSLGTAVWLITTGQLGNVDGLFLLLVSLVFGLAFVVCIISFIKSGMESIQSEMQSASPAPASAKARPVVQQSEQPAATSEEHALT